MSSTSETFRKYLRRGGEMNKSGKIIIIVVSIVVLSLFESLLIKGLSGQKQMIGVCVSKFEIPQNTVISEEMIALQSLPTDALPAFVITNQQDIVGKFSTISLQPGELISSNRIIVDQDGTLTSKGKVRISLMPDSQDALGWQLDKGEFVNLLCYKNAIEDFKISEFKNIKIIDLIDSGFKSIKQTDLDKKPKYLLLEVTPSEARDIAKWRAIGKVVIIGKGK